MRSTRAARLVLFGAAVAAIGAGLLPPSLRAVAASSPGIISTVAGPGSNGDGGPPTNAVIRQPGEVTFAGGDLYIAEPASNRLRRIVPGADSVIGGPGDTDDLISTVAGSGSACANSGCGNGGSATAAQIAPMGITVDASGNLYISEGAGVRFVCEQTSGCTLPTGAGGPTVANGVIISLAGGNGAGTSGDGGSATSARFQQPRHVALDGSGNLWIADANGDNVRFVCMQTTTCTVYPGAPSTCGNGTQSCSITAAPGTVQTVAGSYLCQNATSTNPGTGDGGVATRACFGFGPSGLAFDSSGDLFISDSDGSNPGSPGWIREVNLTTGIVSTTATGTSNYTPTTPIDVPWQIQWSPTGGAQGTLYVADYANDAVFSLTLSNSRWSTVAGSPAFGSGFGGDGGPATSALLDKPVGVAFDSVSGMYIGDAFNNRIRKVSSGGTISTIAGTGGTTPALNDGGPAISAALNFPRGVAYDIAHQSLYIADRNDGRVRKVSSTGVISTIAGTGAAGNSGDNGPATSATFELVEGLAVDGQGNLYISDSLNANIRFVCLQTTTCPTPFGFLPSGDILTVAGSAAGGFSGDGGLATSASLNGPAGMAVDANGNLYIADGSNNRIRFVCMQPTTCTVSGRALASGDITTVAGGGTACTQAAWPCGDGGIATAAALHQPFDVTVDRSGNVYIADTNDAAVRFVCLQTTVCGLPFPTAPGVSAGMLASGAITTIAGTGPASPGFSGDGGSAAAALVASPTSVALDAAGNLYLADSGNERVRVVCLQSTCPTYLGSQGITQGVITTVAGSGGNGGYNSDGIPANQAALNVPTYLTVDTANDVFISDSSNNRIREVAAPVTLEPYGLPLYGSFANQQVGTTSGSQTMTFTNPTASAVGVWISGLTGANGADFSVAGTTCGTSSATAVSVAGNGGTCTAQVTFRPTTFGRRSATITFNDGATVPPTAGLVGLADSAKVAVVGSCSGSGCVGGALYAKQDAQPYQSLGGTIEATPTLVSVPGGPGTTPMVLYIGVGSDTNLYVRSDTQGWQAFGPGGTSCLDSPGAVVTLASGGGYELTVGCQGSDHALYYAQVPVSPGTLPSLGTGGWVNLGGTLNAGPAVTALNGSITFIVTGAGGQLWQRGISSGYAPINGSCLNHAAVATNRAGTTAYLACHGTDNALYLSLNSGSGWGPFTGFGGSVQQSPGIAVTSTEVTIWVEGSDSALYHRTTTPSGSLSSGYIPDGGSIQLGAGGTALVGT